jgi:hypothetical protein
MTYLSRLTKLGLAKETTQYTYLAPTVSIPFTTAQFEDHITPLRDESVRANDAIVQGIQQGVWSTTWDLELNAYADLTGHWLRAMIGPDTLTTTGVSTTLASNCLAGATSLTLTLTVPTGSVIQISDTAGANLEWVKVTTIGTAATVTVPATGTKYAHTAIGGAVISQSTHKFVQNRTFATVWPTYSFTTDDGADQLGWPGCVCADLMFKIDPKGFVTVSPKFMGFPSATQSTFAYAASSAQPVVGWAWTVTNGGATSTRGLSMDITLKRPTEPIFPSTGLQSPREVFPGALEIDGTYKAIFENSTDMNLYIAATQLPTVHTLTQPVTSGGAVLAITMSQSGYTMGKREVTTPYVQADFSLSGIMNATDTGVASVSLTNYVGTIYLQAVSGTSRRVTLQVGNGSPDQRQIIAKKSDCCVAPKAEDAAHPARLVVVVNVVPRFVAPLRRSADRAPAALAHQ